MQCLLGKKAYPRRKVRKRGGGCTKMHLFLKNTFKYDGLANLVCFDREKPKVSSRQCMDHPKET